MAVHYVMHGLVAFFLVAAGRSRQPLLTAGCVVAAGAAAVLCHLDHANEERRYHT